MRINGKQVKASRLFLGNEYKIQVKKLSEMYQVSEDYHKTVQFDEDAYYEITKEFEHLFKWESIKNNIELTATELPYDTFEDAYHHLMIELVKLQVQSIETAKGDDQITKLYVDGGFSDNDVYIKLLSHYLRNMELRTTDASLGSALGAAISISDTQLNSKFLKKNYSLKKHVPLIIK